MICLTPPPPPPPPFVYSCSFSSRRVNKIADFCYEKVYVRLSVQLRSICKKRKGEGNKVIFKNY